MRGIINNEGSARVRQKREAGKYFLVFTNYGYDRLKELKEELECTKAECVLASEKGLQLLEKNAELSQQVEVSKYVIYTYLQPQ